MTESPDLQNAYSPNEQLGSNPQLVLESAWRVPKWPMMKEALTQVEISCPKELVWKVNLYRGYIAICHPEDPHLMTMIDKLVEVASNQVFVIVLRCIYDVFCSVLLGIRTLQTVVARCYKAQK